jgi:hypothetical protein
MKDAIRRTYAFIEVVQPVNSLILAWEMDINPVLAAVKINKHRQETNQQTNAQKTEQLSRLPKTCVLDRGKLRFLHYSRSSPPYSARISLQISDLHQRWRFEKGDRSKRFSWEPPEGGTQDRNSSN